MEEKTKCFEGAEGVHLTVCAQCGYRFVRSDEILRVNQTGDLIHKDCWTDYCDDNVEELTYEMEF